MEKSWQLHSIANGNCFHPQAKPNHRQNRAQVLVRARCALAVEVKMKFKLKRKKTRTAKVSRPLIHLATRFVCGCEPPPPSPLRPMVIMMMMMTSSAMEGIFEMLINESILNITLIKTHQPMRVRTEKKLDDRANNELKIKFGG